MKKGQITKKVQARRNFAKLIIGKFKKNFVASQVFKIK